jgi:hypothetical protein
MPLLRQFLLKPILQTIVISCFSIAMGLYTFYCRSINNLEVKQFADLLTLFAQLSGILLGFLIGFLFFTFQSQETLKMQWFLGYRKTVDELVAKFVTMPEELQYISQLFTTKKFEYIINVYPDTCNIWFQDNCVI